MRGILDRIEDGSRAVIILEEEGREIILPASRLPEGSDINSWFTIEVENGDLVILLDEETTQLKEEQAKTLIQKLRRKKSDSRFKRN